MHVFNVDIVPGLFFGELGIIAPMFRAQSSSAVSGWVAGGTGEKLGLFTFYPKNPEISDGM